MPLTQLHQSINDHWRNEEVLWAAVIQSQTKCTRSEALRVAHRIITSQARNEPTRIKEAEHHGQR